MIIDIIPMGIITLFMGMGIYNWLVFSNTGLKVKMSLEQRIKLSATRQVDISDLFLEDIRKKAIIRANVYRNGLFIASICLIALAMGFGFASLKNAIKLFVLVVLVYLITMPKDSYGAMPTLLGKILTEIQRRKMARLDNEIYQSAALVKTLALLNREDTLSADYIFEKVFEHSNGLKKQYGLFLTLYRGGKRQEAFGQLRRAINTKGGRQFVFILEKLEYLDPKEMVEQIQSFQQGILEEIVTCRTKEIDKGSVIITLASTATIFAIILNFAIVGVFMDSLEMISGIF